MTAALLLLLGGCEAEPNALSWGVRFDSDADRSRARYVEATIYEGGCEGERVFRSEIPLVGGTPSAPGNLAAGTYGFEGRARDVSCAWFAEGCIEVDLPTEFQPVIVTLAVTEPPMSDCPATECIDGRCLDDDAGVVDGSVDSTIPDGSRDTAVDTSPPDACIPGATELCNAFDDDCDLRVDEGIDLTSDSSNCGSCGNVCRDESRCMSSACVCGDGDTYDPGEGKCRNTDIDPSHCGAIGNSCEHVQYCVAGSCECRPGFMELSDGSCTDLSRDPDNCGGEGSVCDTGSMRTCQSGACQDGCSTGQMNCSNACIDLMSDPRHCGGCGMDCERGRVCVAGSCREYKTEPECSSCPCSECEGSERCCPYGPSLIICVEDGAPSCPSY